MGVKAEIDDWLVIVFWCELHMNEEFWVGIFNDILIFDAWRPFVGVVVWWEMKNVETLEMVNEIFDDIFSSEVFEIEIALAVGMYAIALRLQAFDDLLPNGGSGFLRVVHAAYKVRCRLIPWQVGISTREKDKVVRRKPNCLNKLSGKQVNYGTGIMRARRENWSVVLDLKKDSCRMVSRNLYK